MNIIPMPKYLKELGGTYKGEKTLYMCPESYNTFKYAFDIFNIKAEAYAGSQNIAFYAFPSLKEEEYEINVNESNIEVYYSTQVGAFRAITTLGQILKNDEIPTVKIHDLPDIPVRGLMVVVRENLIPTMDYLKSLVDLLCLVKYNALQLYFDSLVFEYDSFKKYLEGKAILTKQDIKELDVYCQERHIELMANQEVLGHMADWLKIDELKKYAIHIDGKKPFTLNPVSDEALEFAKRIFDDLLPNYTSGNVHIGMDEAYGLGLGETESYCKTFGEGQLLSDYITKISTYLKEKHGKRSMIWGDYVVKYRDALDKLPKDVIFVDWGYEIGHSFDRNILAAQSAGLDVYVAPGNQTWGSFSGRTDVTVQNIFEAAEAARFHKIKGFLLTDWQPDDYKLTWAFTYCLGGAFAWNAGYNNSIAESGNEVNCSYRNRVVHEVLTFFDKAILKNTSKTSCADIIYRMGNYYHFEQPDSVATWNGTQLYNTFFAKGLKNGEFTEETLSEIIRYMSRLKDKLSSVALGCDDAESLIEELYIEIETVIAAATAAAHMIGANEVDFPNVDLKALKHRRATNWRRYNVMCQTTVEYLDKIYDAFNV